MRNFTTYAFTDCNSDMHSCFIADCIPEEDLDCSRSLYAKVIISASNTPTCLENHSCENFACTGAFECEVTFCSEETLEEGEICFASANTSKSISDTHTISDTQAR